MPDNDKILIVFSSFWFLVLVFFIYILWHLKLGSFEKTEQNKTKKNFKSGAQKLY